jgi:DNA-binding response OmpR family regulator
MQSPDKDTLSRFLPATWASDRARIAVPRAGTASLRLVRLLYASARVVRILLIDCDGNEAAALAALLEPSGFRVTVATSPDDETLEDVSHFDGVALGAQGPLEERTKSCRHLREGGYLKVILAVCSGVQEGEALLDAGADDFVTRPFEALELVARMRSRALRAAALPRLQWGLMDLDRVHRVLRLRGRSVALTARECELLVGLMEARGQAVLRADLRERVLHGREDRGSNIVEVHLSRLREKLGEDAGLIETVRRAGYRLRR